MNFTEENNYSGSGSFSSLGSDDLTESKKNMGVIIFGYIVMTLFLCVLACLLCAACSLIFKDCIKCCFRKPITHAYSNSSFDVDSYGRFDSDSGSDYDVEKAEPPPIVNTIVLKETSWDTISIQSTELVCAICCENLEEFDKVVKLNCNHIYHQDCINKWVKEKKLDPSCPMCREYII